jgi:hypothetical protein
MDNLIEIVIMTQNTTDLNSTNSLAIAGVVIRQDEHGRYCLNDLHKAAGNEAKYKPANWLRTQQAIDLIALLESENCNLKPIDVINGGVNRGTYAIKELVYAYATWISAKFFLTVIRAYDAMVNNKPPYGLKQPVIDPVYSPIHLTDKMRKQINSAVNYQTAISGVTQEVIYGNLKREFGYETITTADITLYPQMCQRLGIPVSEPIPEYLWVEGGEFERLRDASIKLAMLEGNANSYFELVQKDKLMQLQQAQLQIEDQRKIPEWAEKMFAKSEQMFSDTASRIAGLEARARVQVGCDIEALQSDLIQSQSLISNCLRVIEGYQVH